MHNRFAKKKNPPKSKPLLDFIIKQANQVASSFLAFGYVRGSREKYFLACHKNEEEGEALLELSELISLWHNLAKEGNETHEENESKQGEQKFDR